MEWTRHDGLSGNSYWTAMDGRLSVAWIASIQRYLIGMAGVSVRNAPFASLEEAQATAVQCWQERQEGQNGCGPV
ncbi:MAG: hypothetical protein HC884_04525 [Chloroflexaceae bacterium]|nr:hypothetical protein [Chloroflexaceae bacterium]